MVLSLYSQIVGDHANCGTPSNTITLTGAGDGNVNGTYNKVNATEWDGPNQSFLFFQNGQWVIVTGQETEYCSTPGNFPCVWTVCGQNLGQAPPPTGHYA
jgi:hypothetical protein